MIAQSVRDKIIAAAVAALNNGASKPGTAYRTRTDALSSGELPAYLVCPTTEQVQRISGASMGRKLTLRIEAMTAGAPPQDAALDPLLTYAVETLWTDATFRGLIQGMSEGKVLWEVMGGETDYACGALELEVEYLTAADPAQPKAGYSGTVSLSSDGATWSPLAELANVAFDLQTAMLPVTNVLSSGEEFLPDLPSWKATARELYLAGDAAQNTLLVAFFGGARLYFRFDPAGEGTGLDRLSGYGFISQCKFDQQPTPNQPVWTNLVIQGSGALARTAQ